MQIAGHKTRAIFDRYHIVSDGDLQKVVKRLDSARLSQTNDKDNNNPPSNESRKPANSLISFVRRSGGTGRHTGLKIL